MPPDGIGGASTDRSFREILTAAVEELTRIGFKSTEQIARWIARLRESARGTMTPDHVMESSLRETLGGIFRSRVEKAGLLKYHPGVARFTLARVAPRLRAELDRRIAASAGLIRLNRAEAVETTMRRFSGWATSVPDGGSDVIKKIEVKQTIQKPLTSLPFRERRVAIDQGHKLTANLNNIVSQDAGAIALIWRSHWRQENYNYRKDHKERDGKVYLIRGSWAQEKGFVKAGNAGYYDDVTAVGEEVFCRCYATYLYSLRKLPDDMLTAKGREELERVRIAA